MRKEDVFVAIVMIVGAISILMNLLPALIVITLLFSFIII